MSFINLLIKHSAVRNRKIQGNTCYLTKFFLHDLNHLTVAVSCLVECSSLVP